MHASFIRDMFAHRRPEVLGVDRFLCVSVYVCVSDLFFVCVWWDLGLRVVDILYASHSLASF